MRLALFENLREQRRNFTTEYGVSRRKKGALGLCRNADQLVFCNIHLMYPIFA